MAKVICSPTLNIDCRRKLPIGGSSALAGPREVADSKVPGEDGITEGMDIHEPKRQASPETELLRAERDDALSKAATAEAQLSELRDQLVEEERKASDKGYREGFQQGSEKAAADLAEKIEALSMLLESLSREQIKLIQLAEDAAVEIGFAAAAKIFGHSRIDRELLEAMIKEAIDKVTEREGLVIHLKAEDCRRMVKLRSQCPNQWSGIEFKEDDRVEWGGCIVRSRVGFLDARLEHQVMELKKLLVGARDTRKESEPG